MNRESPKLTYAIRLLYLQDAQLEDLPRLFADLGETNRKSKVIVVDLSYSRRRPIRRAMDAAIRKYPDIRYDFYFGINSMVRREEFTLPKYVTELVQSYKGILNFSFVSLLPYSDESEQPPQPPYRTFKHYQLRLGNLAPSEVVPVNALLNGRGEIEGNAALKVELTSGVAKHLKGSISAIRSRYSDIQFEFFIQVITPYDCSGVVLPEYAAALIRRFGGKVRFSFCVS